MKNMMNKIITFLLYRSERKLPSIEIQLMKV